MAQYRFQVVIPPGAESAQTFGINNAGTVVGSANDSLGSYSFVYDLKKDCYETLALDVEFGILEINNSGVMVGDIDGVCAIRDKNGSVKMFAIDASQSLPGQSRARGISESGLVTGFYVNNVFEFSSYVTTLSNGDEFETVTLAADEIVYQKPCNANLGPPPGPGYDLFTDVTASQVRNDGVVVGSCTDVYFNEPTGDFIATAYGFVATLL